MCPNLGVVVVHWNIGNLFEADGVVLIIVQHIVADICVVIIVVIVVKNQLVFFFFGVFHLLSLRVFSVGNHGAGLGRFDGDLIARVRADDRRFIQVVKAFPGFGAKTLGSPFFVRHGLSLQNLVSHLQWIDANCHKQHMVSKPLVHVIDGNLDMSRHLLNGNPSIEVTLRRSTRARRLSLRVSRLDGRVTLTMPHRLAEREALEFLYAREDWLRGHLAQVSDLQVPQIGGSVLFEGTPLPIVAGQVKRVVLRDGVLVVPDEQARVGPRLKAFMKLRARDALAGASDHYADLLGQSYSRISLRDTRSRWGSCSSAGALMYSWRLIMAPPEVLRYVAAHEVAHLVEMNHAPAFWEQVAMIFPDYRPRRQWLRDHGDKLHRVQFHD